MVKAFLAERGVQANSKDVAQRHAERVHATYGNCSRTEAKLRRRDSCSSGQGLRGDTRPQTRGWVCLTARRFDLVSVLPVNVSDGTGSAEWLVRAARYADCCLVHLSCQHVGSTCPLLHLCAQLAPGQQPKDTAMLKSEGGSMQDGTDVPLRIGRYLYVHGVVTNRGSNLEKSERVRTTASTKFFRSVWRGWCRHPVVLHSFSTDQPRLRVCSFLSISDVH